MTGDQTLKVISNIVDAKKLHYRARESTSQQLAGVIGKTILTLLAERAVSSIFQNFWRKNSIDFGAPVEPSRSTQGPSGSAVPPKAANVDRQPNLRCAILAR